MDDATKKRFNMVISISESDGKFGWKIEQKKDISFGPERLATYAQFEAQTGCTAKYCNLPIQTSS